MMAARGHRTMSLTDLLAGITDAPDVAIGDVSLDSRSIGADGLFIAVQGHAHHGIEFVDQALVRGAVAIATDLAPEDLRVQALARRIPVLSIGRDRSTPALIAARWFEAPSERLRMLAVTGTNGKSSVSWLIAAALRVLGQPAGVIGTLGSGALNALRPESLTTPDAVSLQRRLAELNADGLTTVAIEASSHALDQARLAHVAIDVAVFSNLSRDHLDYHQDMASYFEAKAALFTCESLGERVIAIDDPWGRTLAARYPDAVQVSSGTQSPDSDRFVIAEHLRMSAAGTEMEIVSHAGRVPFSSPLIGAFNVQNLLLAFAALQALGLDGADIAAALGASPAPPGRMQRAAAATPAVFVDFAHTPDALAAALVTLRALTDGALWCVFGCGGDRDRGKRALMAQAAEQHADQVLLTSDNPRSEAIEAIFDDMQQGLTRPPFAIIADRRDAIRSAVNAAADNDVILIAGKGHESQQAIGARRLPFDDLIEARLAIRDREARS